MAWRTQWAPTRQELAACVDCGLCLPHCPTFRLTGDEAASPRGRLAAMRAVAAGEADIDEVFEELMAFCLQCRACEAACPSLAPFGRAMEGARAEVAATRPTAGSRFRRVLLGSALGSRPLMRAATFGAALAQRFRGARWLPGSVGQGLGGLRPLPWIPPTGVGSDLPAHGRQVGVAALLAGCVMDTWFSPVHRASVEVLRRSGYRVVVPAGQTCCGALAAHDGAASEAETMAARNVTVLGGVDLVVADAAGCAAHLKDYRHWAGWAGAELAGRVRDITEAVAEAIDDGRLPHLETNGRRVAVQDPCHLRHAQRITREPRLIIEAAGYEVVEIDVDGLCCGAAGVYTVLRSETSAQLGRAKADQVRASGASIVASANPGCEIQLRSHLGDGYRVAHPVELYAERL